MYDSQWPLASRRTASPAGWLTPVSRTRYVAALAIALSVTSAETQSQAVVNTGSTISVSLITVGPGPDPTSWLGHSALRIDTGNDSALLYSFGVVPYSYKAIVGALSGRMLTTSGVKNAQRELARLARAGRIVRVQELDLAPGEKRRLADLLESQVGPTRPSYYYDLLQDNCSTRIRDLLNEATDGRLRVALTATPAPRSLREAGILNLGTHIVTAVIADFFVGAAADRTVSAWELAANPVELAEAMQSVAVQDDSGRARPLVTTPTSRQAMTRQSVLVRTSRWVDRSWLLFASLLVSGVALVSLIMLPRQARATHVIGGACSAFLGLVLGVPGTVLFLASLSDSHSTMAHNANLLLANPLTLLAIPFGIACCQGRVRSAERLALLWPLLTLIALVGLVTNAWPTVDHGGSQAVVAVLPILLGTALASGIGASAPRRRTCGITLATHRSSFLEPSS
ncbi:MAG: DUF4105 domain-containing protein [Gemmatimonas sp.]